MKKTVLILSLMLVFLVASVASAAPLTKYEPGSVAINLDMHRSKLKASFNDGDSGSFGSKWNFGYGVEVGVAKKFALQIDGFNDKSKDYHWVDSATEYGNANGKLQNWQAKIKYEVLKQDNAFLAAYLGVARNKVKFNYNEFDNGVHDSYAESTKSKTSALIGVTGVVDLAKDVKMYADLGLGTKSLSWNIGASYVITENVEFDLGYKWYKAKSLKYTDGLGEEFKLDATSKGIYMGFTFKFN